jgi:hypothetical protein
LKNSSSVDTTSGAIFNRRIENSHSIGSINSNFKNINNTESAKIFNGIQPVIYKNDVKIQSNESTNSGALSDKR